MSFNLPSRRIYTPDVINDEGAIDPERLLYVINLFLEATFEMADKGMNLGDHVNGDIVTLNFNTGNGYSGLNTFSPILFNSNLKGKRPEAVLLGRIVDTEDQNKIFFSPVSISWVETIEQIKINYISGLEDNKSYRVTVVVL